MTQVDLTMGFNGRFLAILRQFRSILLVKRYDQPIQISNNVSAHSKRMPHVVDNKR